MNKLTMVSAALCLAMGTSVYAAPGGGEQGSTNGQPFKTINERIDILEMELGDAIALINNRLDLIEQEQLEQNARIDFLMTALTALEMRVTTNENHIATLTAIQDLQGQLIDALRTDLTALEIRVAQNENDIAALVLADAAMQALITAIQGEIVTINARIDANDTDISALQQRASELEQQLLIVSAELQTKQARVTGICEPGSSIREIFENGDVTCEPTNGAGVTALNTYRSSGVIETSNNLRSVTDDRYCLSGDRVVGGGHLLAGGQGSVLASYPISDGGWRITGDFNSAGKRTLTTYALCVGASQ
ncbi:hypothetical protein [Pseudoalteromonas sp. BDTF-M6]|uniref:hypothetical protein n=1 Tax=Pseudoalteromonas sp. BDTF-M6 TaxID=2796132 RepID=UPI001BAEF62E|nr:hypothetical protein [Pseudoalteromonas sp. BDTF-M6]MBS3797614.1 hypothetical protein [Pseudoalteromonas sp. BDTF-M6]